jgi:hypothetical protein
MQQPLTMRLKSEEIVGDSLAFDSAFVGVERAAVVHPIACMDVATRWRRKSLSTGSIGWINNLEFQWL